jgi:hypothetical protein
MAYIFHDYAMSHTGILRVIGFRLRDLIMPNDFWSTLLFRDYSSRHIFKL